MPFDPQEDTVRYLDGDMYVQPFCQRSSTEVRLHVRPPGDGAYAKRDYSCRDHDQVMFHHNCVVRREHMDGPQATLSYDQALAHDIVGRWADRVADDPSICPDRAGIEPLVTKIIKEMDGHFGRVLALRASKRFGSIVAMAPKPVKEDLDEALRSV